MVTETLLSGTGIGAVGVVALGLLFKLLARTPIGKLLGKLCSKIDIFLVANSWILVVGGVACVLSGLAFLIHELELALSHKPLNIAYVFLSDALMIVYVAFGIFVIWYALNTEASQKKA